MKTMKSLAVALLTVVILSTTLSAHMKFEKSTPAPDSTVNLPLKSIQVWFSEAPDTKVSKIDVKGPSGPVGVTGLNAMGKSLVVMIDGTTPPGTYTVSWSAGDDGHVQKGEFMFMLNATK